MATSAPYRRSRVSAAGAVPHGGVPTKAEGGRGEVRGLPGPTEDKDGRGQEEETGERILGELKVLSSEMDLAEM